MSKGIRGTGGVAPHVLLNIYTIWTEWPPSLPVIFVLRNKSPRLLLRRRQAYPLSRTGLFLEEANILCLPKIEPRFAGHPARSTVTVPSTIFRDMSVVHSTTLTATHTEWSLPTIYTFSRTNFSIIQGRVAILRWLYELNVCQTTTAAAYVSRLQNSLILTQ